ncbi:vesicle transport protein SFT2B-like isoform X3 [Durio zibethinus]|uniref:Vesicle transport protein n=1 Tax=Durio zibethinus TaxID=66656 RepID=A0A6P5ZD90_DURZI|nr:vesicle transport protein SFT2B-like isoform X3 [Durio zibethinus]
MEKMSHAFEKMKMLVGMEGEDYHQQPAIEDGNSFSFMDDFNSHCTLTTKQRFYGFAICFVAGLTCTLLSILVFFHPIKFGITFTFGNLLSLGSTAFLIGPKRQVSMMFDPVRIYATAIYLASMIIALFCAFYVYLELHPFRQVHGFKDHAFMF